MRGKFSSGILEILPCSKGGFSNLPKERDDGNDGHFNDNCLNWFYGPLSQKLLGSPLKFCKIETIYLERNAIKNEFWTMPIKIIYYLLLFFKLYFICRDLL